MKKKLVILAVILLAAAGLYAEGRGEDSLGKYRNQVTVTGTLQFANGFPAISADGKTYNLFAPRLMRAAYSLKPGLPLTVEGIIMQQGPQMQGRAPADAGRPAASESIFVQKVTIDGKTYEAQPDRQAPGSAFGGGRDFRPGKGQWDGQRGGFCGNHRDGGRRGSGRGWEGRREFGGPGSGRNR
jgi:hypothetical protein